MAACSDRIYLTPILFDDRFRADVLLRNKAAVIDVDYVNHMHYVVKYFIARCKITSKSKLG